MTLFSRQSLASPPAATFVASCLLSLIAIAGGTLNRDGMLYAEAARAFMNDGLAAAFAVFGWPFLAVLMGALAKLSGLPPEWWGHALNVLFMAGTCALMVALVGQSDRRLAWLAGLVILALPGLNQYRNELIREYGCWFFILLSFHLARGWPENPGWGRALAIQLALGLAALFRPEAAAFLPCIVLWQHFEGNPASRWRRTLMLACLPAVGLAAILVAHFAGLVPASSRIANEISRFDFSTFDRTARDMSQAFNAYARDDAQTAHLILFFGSLALIPWKLIGKFGPFILPLLWFFRLPDWRPAVRRYRLLLIAIIAHLLILAVFVLQQQFISGRYYSLILIFSTPLVALGLNDILNRLPRWRWAIVALCGAMALSNVVSLKPGKAHFAEAGRWLATQIADGPRVYLEGGRTAHYAGWKYSGRPQPAERDALLDQLREDRFDVVILEVSRKDSALAEWLATAGLREIRRFSDANGDAIVVCVPEGRPFPPPPAKPGGAPEPTQGREAPPVPTSAPA